MVSAQTVKNLMRHPGEIGRALARRMKRVPALLRTGRTIKNLIHVNRLAMRVENLEHMLAAGEEASRKNPPDFLPDQAEIEELRIALHRETRRSREVETLLQKMTEAMLPLRRMDATRRRMIEQALDRVRRSTGEMPPQAAILGRDGVPWMQGAVDLDGLNIQSMEADADTLPYLRHCQSQSLDMIMIPHTGERIPLAELTESLSECARVLRNGGALVWEMTDSAMDREAYSPLADPTLVTMLRPETQCLLVKQAGMTEVQQEWTVEWQDQEVGCFRDHILIAFQE